MHANRGVYSVPAWAPVGEYAEWYWYRLENGSGPTYVRRRLLPPPGALTHAQDFHVANWGPDFGYQVRRDVLCAHLT